jgi:hypothetical protein
MVAPVVFAMICGTATAQSLRNAEPPAEFPPASFRSDQYVDSRGCVFIRAGISGNVTWVPRVNRGRKQLCGYTPSLTPAQIQEAQRASRPSDGSSSIDIVIEPQDRSGG